MAESNIYRELGPTESYLQRCHQHGSLNITVALTIHTRSPLDPGVVKVGLQEMQHQHPQLTSRIARKGGRDVFSPMECPVLPLDEKFECRDVIHEKFNTETGPLWRVQIVTIADLEVSNMAFGPEVEAIIEDDSTIETRWRYILRYMQGRLNRDIENFEEEAEQEEGRSVILMTFHPAITDTTGALYLAKQFISILDMKLNAGEEPLSLGQAEPFPRSLESVLPATDSYFQLGDLMPMVKAVGSHFMPLRRSPFEEFLVTTENSNGNDPKSKFLRGWLNETETRELKGLCEEEDVSLHGIVMAASLTAMSRLCTSEKMISPELSVVLKAQVSMNLRQYCDQAPRNGSFSAHYEENYTVPPVIDSADLWRFAHTLTVHHNVAKANKQAVRQVRLTGKLVTSAGGLEAVGRELEARKLETELNLTVHGDLGHIFRRESSSDLDQQQQLRLEDVMVLVSAQNLGSPFSHSAHIFRGRLNYVLGYYTNFVDTAHALLLRDETINLLRLAVDQ